MFEKLEIGDRIDERIAQDFEELNVSVALVLTGLGFVQQRLLSDRPVFSRRCRPIDSLGRRFDQSTQTTKIRISTFDV